MSLPHDRYYSSDHVWLARDGETRLLGITEHAQDALGQIESINLPAIGERLVADAICGTLESVKTVSDLVAPIAATVIEHNAAVASDPGIVNDEPFEGGWLVRLSEFAETGLTELLTSTEYAEMI